MQDVDRMRSARRSRGSRRAPGTAVAAVAALIVAGATVGALVADGTGDAAETGQRRSSRVVDETGAPVAGAVVSGGGERVRTDEDGSFVLPLEDPALVTVEAAGHLPRTLALAPGHAADVPLTAERGATVSLRIGGDVMFGRRYFDPDEDGDPSDGLLPVGASSEEHAALLQHVRPLLEDADLTVVNLETPLVDEPWFAPGGPRPVGWHPTKEVVFASAPQSVAALRAAGVDVVSLGNNHVLDALEPGLAQTIAELDRQGMPHFGAGTTVDDAWRPALLEHDGQVVAMLGCTTITGTEHPVPYVATPEQAGAAWCTAERLDEAVRDARARADVVVAMLHGGEEYEAEQTDPVRRLTQVALDAGATVVANGHPHVVGGVALRDGALVAETTGNLLFDQDVWPTFLSYLLRVDVRDGAPVLATTDPLLLEDYVPRPVVGQAADASSRRAAGLLAGGGLLSAPGAVVGAPALPVQQRRLDLPAGEVVPVPVGWWLDPQQPLPAGVAVGEELLWTGSFEDADTDPATGGAPNWSWGSSGALSAAAACTGEQGLELRRSPLSTEDVVGTPDHRQLVAAGTRLTLLADVRHASDGSLLELRFYPDTHGGSSSSATVPLPAGSFEECRTVRLDALAPPGTVAVQPFLRLAPPEGPQRAARLAVDDVRLVAWADSPATGPRWSAVESADGGRVVLAGGPGAR